MRIYDRYDERGNVYDKQTKSRGFIEIIPCSQCKVFLWIDDERALIRNAVELIWALSDFELDTWHALSATYSGRDANDAIHLSNLLNPLRELSEYDSDEIGLLEYVLRLAAFAGPANINIKLLNVVWGKLQRLVAHIESKHRDDLAPWSRFSVGYLDWIDEKRLLSYLPGIRGKSESEITAYLKREWERLERCKKCKEILALGQDEGKLSGLCHKCEPQHVFENGADGKRVPSQ